ncbi:MAG: PAS domain S-box protein [Elusimicrobiota bacterium]|nr:MAG: PAS domain S-box protein [Elusimicrobiota bacterium]
MVNTKMPNSHPKRSSRFPSTVKGKPAEVWVEKTAQGVRLNARKGDSDASRQTLDELDDMVLLADDEGRYLDANDPFCRVTGYSLDEALGLSVRDITSPDLSTHVGGLWRRFMGQGAMAGRYELKLKNGKVRVVAYQAVTNVLPGVHISLLRPL